MDLRLTIDRGNTALKAAVWRSGSDSTPQTLVTLPADASVAEIMSAVDVCGRSFGHAAYSSVVSHCRATDLSELSHAVGHVVDVSCDVCLPFRSLYRTPHTLGADRIAALAGASVLCAGDAPEGIVVADLGTADTYDYLQRRDGGYVHIGGNISPGVPLRLRSLTEHTSALPAVSPDRTVGGALWGDSTEDALANGAVYGVLAELHFYLASAPGSRIVLTGGGAEYLVGNRLINFDHIYDPHLVMRGLNHIINEN